VGGVAKVTGTGQRGVLAGFSLMRRRGETTDALGSAVGWLSSDGEWSEEADVVGERVLAAACSAESHPVDPAALRTALDALTIPIRARLSLAAGRRWLAAEPNGSARRIAERLSQGVAEAARARNQRTLTRLERALRFIAGGHTAGEDLLLERMMEASTADLLAWLDRMPASVSRSDPIEVGLTGLVVFEA
jgi:hypothetical protein